MHEHPGKPPDCHLKLLSGIISTRGKLLNATGFSGDVRSHSGIFHDLRPVVFKEPDEVPIAMLHNVPARSMHNRAVQEKLFTFKQLPFLWCLDGERDCKEFRKSVKKAYTCGKGCTTIKTRRAW